MPQYLRRDVIRLFEASVESLYLACLGLGMPKRKEVRSAPAQNAPLISLIGISSELAMSACLVQADGIKAIEKNEEGQFKTSKHIIHEFKKLIKESKPSSMFLFKGIKNPAIHSESLLSKGMDLMVLSSSRAGGLHAGQGPEREISICMANKVADFLSLLAESEKIKTYIGVIPRPPDKPKDNNILLEELIRKIKTDKTLTKSEISSLLCSAYLILPHIPDEEPDWFSELEKLPLSATDHDIHFLLNSLEKSLPITLRKATGSEDSISVRIDKDNPDAIPVSPQHLKTEYNTILDKFDSDAASANGRLKEGVVDLPPVDFLYDLFSVDFEKTGLLKKEGILSAHKAWPFIASSLSVAGTQGPYWFLIRKIDDLGQLKAKMTEATKVGNANLKKNLHEFSHGIERIIRKKDEKEMKDPLIEGLRRIIQQHESINPNKDKIAQAIRNSKGTERQLSATIERKIIDAIESGSSVGPIISDIFTLKITEEVKNYWFIKLIDMIDDVEDVFHLSKIIKSKHFSGAKTIAKKMVRAIDFVQFGPPVA